jgi:predicted deacylase
MNRIWSPQWLDGPEDSPELRRARAMRPAVLEADHILDLHSTSQPVQPFWVYPQRARNTQAACAIGRPAVHLVMPAGLGSGVPLIQHGAHGLAEGAAGEGGVALVAECGQHFQRATAALATEVTLDFLAHFGLVAREPAPGARDAAQTRVELLRTVVVRTSEFRFARPVVGFETFDEGELIATDGDEEIRAPCPRCTILMPARQPVPGREGVYLARPL